MKGLAGVVYGCKKSKPMVLYIRHLKVMYVTKYWYICILFLLHPIDNKLVVQYQLVQGCLNHVYIIIIKKKIRMEKGTL